MFMYSSTKIKDIYDYKYNLYEFKIIAIIRTILIQILKVCITSVSVSCGFYEYYTYNAVPMYDIFFQI